MSAFLYKIILLFKKIERYCRNKYYKSILDIHPSVNIGDCVLDRLNISIGEGSYIRSGEIASGQAKVIIGCYCAIGSNVSIRARTHDMAQPTAGPGRPHNKKKFADINIGNHVWIGNNVFIKEGVRIADHAIIGANSVVVTDVPRKAIFAGIPAKLIRYNDELINE